MAFVMIAGPQILSAIFLATGEDWRRTSAAYVFGAFCSITTVVSAAYFLLNGASNKGASSDAIYIGVLVLLLIAMIHTYRTRKTSEPPKWMGTLQTASPRFAFKLGFLLLGVFPTDILTSVAVGSYLAAHGDPWWHIFPFIALTLLILATPALMLLIFRKRAEAFMPKARQWMNDNSWLVNEVVLLLFVGLTLSNLA
jgi:Sap, sulfolipid-1-addressing protein